jgi:hypothetical protein
MSRLGFAVRYSEPTSQCRHSSSSCYINSTVGTEIRAVALLMTELGFVGRTVPINRSADSSAPPHPSSVKDLLGYPPRLVTWFRRPVGSLSQIEM